VVSKHFSKINLVSSKPIQAQVSLDVSQVIRRLRGLDGVAENACAELEIFLVRDGSAGAT
jgi:hypothetical protein